MHSQSATIIRVEVLLVFFFVGFFISIIGLDGISSSVWSPLFWPFLNALNVFAGEEFSVVQKEVADVSAGWSRHHE
jgi:hypothetical protein